MSPKKKRKPVQRSGKLKVGDTASTGQKVKVIIGQNSTVCVYMTEDGQLRSRHFRTGGKNPKGFDAAFALFDEIGTKIRLNVPRARREALYHLLGLCLFNALDGKVKEKTEGYFRPITGVLADEMKQRQGVSATRIDPDNNRVFIVHGHDEGPRQSVARLMEGMGLVPIILAEAQNAGMHILDKLKHHSNVAFVVVLLTPDDVGGVKGDKKAIRPRARQNVIFELGYFIALMGHSRVCALFKEDVELPSDYQGILYHKYDVDDGWKLKLGKELKAAGLKINLDKLL